MAKRVARFRFCRIWLIACLLAFAFGCSRAPVESIRWNVMGTVAAVRVKGGIGETKAAFSESKVVFKRIETLLNAHSPTSEITKLSKLANSDVLIKCTPFVRPCYEAAFMFQDLTKGSFNPRWRGDKTLDLGAIAKGFAVDKASDKLLEGKVNVPCLIDLGGNLKAVSGQWNVGIKSPWGEGMAAFVDLHEGEALATSATYFRGNHISDARTGKVVSNGVASVTVLCRSAMMADGLSTSLFVLGPEEGRLLLASIAPNPAFGEVSVFWIMEDGRAFGGGRFKQKR